MSIVSFIGGVGLLGLLGILVGNVLSCLLKVLGIVLLLFRLLFVHRRRTIVWKIIYFVVLLIRWLINGQLGLHVDI